MPNEFEITSTIFELTYIKWIFKLKKIKSIFFKSITNGSYMSLSKTQ